MRMYVNVKGDSCTEHRFRRYIASTLQNLCLLHTPRCLSVITAEAEAQLLKLHKLFGLACKTWLKCGINSYSLTASHEIDSYSAQNLLEFLAGNLFMPAVLRNQQTEKKWRNYAIMNRHALSPSSSSDSLLGTWAPNCLLWDRITMTGERTSAERMRERER